MSAILLRVLKLFPDSYAGGVGAGDGFFFRCGARSTWLALSDMCRKQKSSDQDTTQCAGAVRLLTISIYCCKARESLSRFQAM